MSHGTPKTLNEAILNGLEEPVPSPSSPIRIQLATRAEAHLRDFLAQHFSAAMLEHPAAEDVLTSLFNRITRKQLPNQAEIDKLLGEKIR